MSLTLALLIIATAAGIFLTLILGMSRRADSRILAAFTVLLTAVSFLQLTVALKSVLMLYLPFAVFPAIFLQGLIIEIYCRKLLDVPSYRRFTLALLSLPAFLAGGLQVAMFVQYPEFRDVEAVYWQKGYVKPYTTALFVIAMSYNLSFIWVSARRLFPSQIPNQHKAGSTAGSHVWLKIFLSFNAVLCLAGLINIFYNFVADIPAAVNPMTAVLFAGGNYLILTFLIKKPGLFEVSGEQKSESQNGKYAKIQSLDAATRKQYAQKIQKLLADEEEFLSDTFSLNDLSGKLGIAAHLVSMVINTELQQNFYTLINSYRVKKAKELLLAEERPNILEVAYASGFKSKSAFNKVFKQHTGQTPSAFKST